MTGPVGPRLPGEEDPSRSTVQPTLQPTVQPSLQMGRSAAVAAVGTGLSRATGFLRTAAMVYALGVAESRLADTYALANSTPNIVFELILGGVLSSVLIRVYIEVRDRQGADEGWRFISRVTNLSLLVLLMMTAVGLVAAPLIMRAYTLASSASDMEIRRQVGSFLLRLFIPQIVFYAFAQISGAVLQAHRRFGMTMVAPVLNNLTVTAVFIAFAAILPEQLRLLETVPVEGLVLLGAGTTAGVAIFSLTPFLYMRSVGWRWSLKVGFLDPNVKRLARLSVYLLGYVATNQLGLWVALVLAYRVQGGVAGYQTAYVFFQLPHGLLAVSVAAVMFTAMTERAVQDDISGFSARLNQALRAVTFVIVPAIAGYLAIAPHLVRVLLEHGLASSVSTDLLSLVLRAWAPGILFFSIFYVALRAFYALGDTRTPMLINLAAFAVNVVVDLALFTALPTPSAKVAGLAVGHGVSYLVAAAASLVILKRRVGKAALAGLGRAVSTSVAAASATWAAAWMVVSLVEPEGLAQEVAEVAGATLVGLLIYLTVCRILRSQELRWVREAVSGARAG